MQKNFLNLLGALTDAGGEFVIVGGVASAAYGGNRVTFDLDLVPALDPATWPGVIDRIWELGGRPRIPESREAIRSIENVKRWIRGKGMRALTFRSSDGRIEVDFLVGESRRFVSLKRRAKRIEFGGRSFHVASIEDLVSMKRAAGRPQDLLDIEMLEAVSKRVRSRKSRRFRETRRK